MKNVCDCDECRCCCIKWDCIKKWFKERPLLSALFFLAFLILLTIFVLWLCDTVAINLITETKITDTLKVVHDESAVAEFNAWLYFLSGAGAIILAYVAVKQLPSISKESEIQSHMAVAQFLLHIDKEWYSKEMTHVRRELWEVYRKARKEKKLKEKAINEVKKYIMHLEDKSKDHPNSKNMKALFQHLNFLELLGTIYIFKKRKLIEDEEKFFQEIFGGKLHIYLKFYREYLKKYSDCNASKLLDYMDYLERKSTETSHDY